MKIVQKIILICIIIMCSFYIFSPNIVRAGDGDEDEETTTIQDDIAGFKAVDPELDTETNSLIDVVKRFLGILRILTGIVSIILIAFTGFNYIVATPAIKDELKRRMLPLILGVVIVFGATTITSFFLSAFNTTL